MNSGAREMRDAEAELAAELRLPLPDPKTAGREYRKTASVFAVQMERAFRVETLEGVMAGQSGDYLCEGPGGERWPVRREIFEKTYQATYAIAL